MISPGNWNVIFYALNEADVGFREYNPESGQLPQTRGLIYAGSDWLHRDVQELLLRYVSDGGTLILFNEFPQKDEFGDEVNILGLRSPDGARPVLLPVSVHLGEYSTNIVNAGHLGNKVNFFYYHEVEAEPITVSLSQEAKEVLVDIVAVRFKGVDVKWTRHAETWRYYGSLKNAVQIYYYQISSNSRLIEFTEDIHYEKANIRRLRKMWQFFAAVGGGGLRNDQVIYYSRGGEPKEQRIGDFIQKHFVDGRLPNHKTLGSNDDGWIAFHDPVRKNGLAIFGAPKLNNAGLLFNTGVDNRGHPNFRITFFQQRIPENRLVRYYWFLVLEDEDLQTVMDWQTAYLNPLAVYVMECERDYPCKASF